VGACKLSLRLQLTDCSQQTYSVHPGHRYVCAEAIVRGHRAGLLTVADYNNLCQCETMDDIKLNLVGELGCLLLSF
jgi:V-type H+-transporting ATPase subunit d